MFLACRRKLEYPEKNPHRHSENIQTPHRNALSRESNLGPSCCQATVLTMVTLSLNLVLSNIKLPYIIQSKDQRVRAEERAKLESSGGHQSARVCDAMCRLGLEPSPGHDLPWIGLHTAVCPALRAEWGSSSSSLYRVSMVSSPKLSSCCPPPRANTMYFFCKSAWPVLKAWALPGTCMATIEGLTRLDFTRLNEWPLNGLFYWKSYALLTHPFLCLQPVNQLNAWEALFVYRQSPPMIANHTTMFEVLYQVCIFISFTHIFCGDRNMPSQTQKKKHMFTPKSPVWESCKSNQRHRLNTSPSIKTL